MYYRILRGPPGYPPDRAYMVCEYETREPGSCARHLGVAANLEAARALIPRPCRRLDSRDPPADQLVELWETAPSTPEQFLERLYSHKHSLHQLRMMVQRLPEAQRAEALLGVFSDPDRASDSYGAQEVAGDLLVSLRPQPRQPLDAILSTTAAVWNVSVEELPFYLRDVFGREAVIEAAERLAERYSPESREARALGTMVWWLKGKA
jgi:hypothetical protein